MAKLDKWPEIGEHSLKGVCSQTFEMRPRKTRADN